MRRSYYDWNEANFGKPKHGQKPWGICQNAQNLENSILLSFEVRKAEKVQRAKMAFL
jgi:hypothetical protein